MSEKIRDIDPSTVKKSSFPPSKDQLVHGVAQVQSQLLQSATKIAPPLIEEMFTVPVQEIREVAKKIFVGKAHYGEVVIQPPSIQEFILQDAKDVDYPYTLRLSNGTRYALLKDGSVSGVAITHPGIKNKKHMTENEDDFFLSASRAVVCDGVGGHGGGAEGSHQLVEALSQRPDDCVADVVGDVQLALQGWNLRHRIFPLKPSTTFVSAEQIDNQWRIHWAGDSRALLFDRRGKLKFVSMDDVAAVGPADMSKQEDLDRQGRNFIKNFLGAPDELFVLHTQNIPRSQGDILLLVSDGVTDNMNSVMLEREIRHCLQEKIPFVQIPVRLLNIMLTAQMTGIRPLTQKNPKPAKCDAVTILMQKVL